MISLSHLLKSFDFLGPSINFTIKDYPNFRSVIGGFFSLLIYILYLVFFVLFGKDMIYKLNPTVNSEYISPDKIENYAIDNKTFLAFRYENDMGKMINQSYKLYQYSSYVTYDLINSRIINETSLDIINCNNSQFKQDINLYNYKAEEWFCIDYKKIYNSTLNDELKSNNLNYIAFEIQLCEIDDDWVKSNCQDLKKTKEYLSQNHIMISFLYNEVIFNANKYEEPLQTRIKKHSDNINLNLQISNYATIEKTTVEQDDGFLFSNEREMSYSYGINGIEKFFNYKTDEELNNYYNNSTKYDIYFNVYTVFFQYEMDYRKYTRKYMKIQDVFGNVNGFMEFIILVVSLIKLYTKYRFDYYLFNHLVNVCYDEKKMNINIKFHQIRNCDLKSKPIELENINSYNNNIFNNYNNYKRIYELNKFSSKYPHSFIKKKFSKEKNIISNLSYVSQPKSHNRLVEYDIISPRFNLFESNIKHKIGKKRIIPEIFQKQSDNNTIELKKNNLEIKKSICEELRSKLIIKKSQLEPNFFNYYFRCTLNCLNSSRCKNDVNYSLLEMRLLKKFIDKINKKFDIFNYLKRVKEMKNLEDFLFENENNFLIFKILSRNLYEIRIDPIDTNDFSKKSKKNKNELIQEWIESINLSSNQFFTDFVIRKLSN